MPKPIDIGTAQKIRTMLQDAHDEKDRDPERPIGNKAVRDLVRLRASIRDVIAMIDEATA